MAYKLKGTKKLASKIEDLQIIASDMRQELDKKREWLNNKSDKYKESEEAEELESHLNEIEDILNDIDNLNQPSFEE